MTLLEAAENLLAARERLLYHGYRPELQHAIDKAWEALDRAVDTAKNPPTREYDDLQWDEDEMK